MLFWVNFYHWLNGKENCASFVFLQAGRIDKFDEFAKDFMSNVVKIYFDWKERKWNLLLHGLSVTCSHNVFFLSVKDKRDSILEEAKSLIDAQENPK